MEEFKGTKGEFKVRELFEFYEILSDTPYPVATIEKRYRPQNAIKSNTKLICEAFNVVTRTGLTPEQMERRISDLEARLKEAERLTRTLLRSINAADRLKADQVISTIRNEAENLLLFLTKEKTK